MLKEDAVDMWWQKFLYFGSKKEQTKRRFSQFSIFCFYCIVEKTIDFQLEE